MKPHTVSLSTTATHIAHSMNVNQKKLLALQVIRQQKTITDISTQNKVSRKFIYAQKEKAVSAINDAFRE
jgi:hypothetical protein